MQSVTISPELRKYLAARGLNLDALEERPEPDAEPFEPSEEDLADYARWSDRLDAMAREYDREDAAERATYERQCQSWTIRPV